MSWIAHTTITAAGCAWTLLAAAAGRYAGRRGAHAAIAQARAAALHDPLTGLLNRAGLEAAAAGSRSPLVVAVVDLDGFKHINDTRGHQDGDAVLVATAYQLRAYAAPYGGSAARLGGDEFALLLPVSLGATRIMLQDMGARLHQRVTCAPLQFPGTPQITVSASIGLGCMPRGGDLWASIHEADLAMYAAKAAGAGVAVAGPGLIWAPSDDGVLRPPLEPEHPVGSPVAGART